MKDSNKKSLWGAIGLGGLFLLTKMKWVLVLLKVLKLQTLFSMVIFLGTYAIFYGWKFAFALLYLLFVHEMGHLFAAKKLKLPTTPAIFIPFLGAAIGMKERPKNAKDEAFLAYMGPVFGLLAFLPAIPLYFLTDAPFWALVIVLGAIINLFNLIPMSPLDGGRIVAGISTKLWALGLVLLLGYALWTMSILAFFILIIGIFNWASVYKEQKNIGEAKKQVTEYEEILATLKNIVATSSYEHLQYFAKSLVPNLEKHATLQNTLAILNEKDVFETEEARETHREQNKTTFIEAFEQEVKRIRTYTEETAMYYQTEPKTKAKLFAIYIGLIIVLGTCSYFSFNLLPPLK